VSLALSVRFGFSAEKPTDFPRHVDAHDRACYPARTVTHVRETDLFALRSALDRNSRAKV
jgi:hypothetical protein